MRPRKSREADESPKRRKPRGGTETREVRREKRWMNGKTKKRDTEDDLGLSPYGIRSKRSEKKRKDCKDDRLTEVSKRKRGTVEERTKGLVSIPDWGVKVSLG